jgi:hypothetical protein
LREDWRDELIARRGHQGRQGANGETDSMSHAAGFFVCGHRANMDLRDNEKGGMTMSRNSQLLTQGNILSQIIETIDKCEGEMVDPAC